MVIGKQVIEVSPLEFRLDPGTGVPTYLQLVHQVEQALRLGYLKVGDRLPRVKDAVVALAINPNTVLKAYRELEHRGIAAGRPGQGTFVRAAPEVPGPHELTELRRALMAWMRQATTAGLDDDGIAALVASAHRDYRGKRQTSADSADSAGGTS